MPGPSWPERLAGDPERLVSSGAVERPSDSAEAPRVQRRLPSQREGPDTAEAFGSSRGSLALPSSCQYLRGFPPPDALDPTCPCLPRCVSLGQGCQWMRSSRAAPPRSRMEVERITRHRGLSWGGEVHVGGSIRLGIDPGGRWVARMPMDGFHLADAALDRLGRFHRKGAADTFDGWGFLAMLRRIASEQVSHGIRARLRTDTRAANRRLDQH